MQNGVGWSRFPVQDVERNSGTPPDKKCEAIPASIQSRKPGERTISDRDLIKLILAGAALLSAIFFGVSRYYSPDGQVSPPQGDSLIFYQYARAIGEGHPYRFNADDPPSTGSTSHLYPVLLAVPYALGAKGSGLATVGFLLNTIFYLALIFVVWLSTMKMAPSAAPLAAALTAFCGQTVITLFGQTDMGLFAVLAAGSFCAGLYRRYIVLAVLLILATLTRPEGFILSLLLLAASFIPTTKGQRGAVGFTFAGGMGVFAALGVAFLNSRLTGSILFTSILGKGLSVSQPTSGLIENAAATMGAMIKEVFFGLTDGHRRFYLLPVFGGWLGVMGLLSRRWRRDEITRVETWWIAAVLVNGVLIAFSGVGGVQYDRYLAWILPVWFIYVAIGLRQAAGMFPWPRAFMFMALGLLAYQGIGLAYFGSLFAKNTATVASNIRFVHSAAEGLPEGSRIGMINYSGLAYEMPKQNVHNINGIVSPEFMSAESPRMNIEVLRHEPLTRFDAWLVYAGRQSGQWYSIFTGKQIASEMPAFGADEALAFYKADWSTLGRANLPLSASARQFASGMTLVDAVDVGYAVHESRSDYRVFTRIAGIKVLPSSETLLVDGQLITEAGRIILGSETMHVKSRPGREMRIILRTSAAAAAPLNSGLEKFE